MSSDSGMGQGSFTTSNANDVNSMRISDSYRLIGDGRPIGAALTCINENDLRRLDELRRDELKRVEDLRKLEDYRKAEELRYLMDMKRLDEFNRYESIPSHGYDTRKGVLDRREISNLENIMCNDERGKRGANRFDGDYRRTLSDSRKNLSDVKCFRCKESGHYANACNKSQGVYVPMAEYEILKSNNQKYLEIMEREKKLEEQKLKDVIKKEKLEKKKEREALEYQRISAIFTNLTDSIDKKFQITGRTEGKRGRPCSKQLKTITVDDSDEQDDDKKVFQEKKLIQKVENVGDIEVKDDVEVPHSQKKICKEDDTESSENTTSINEKEFYDSLVVHISKNKAKGFYKGPKGYRPIKEKLAKYVKETKSSAIIDYIGEKLGCQNLPKDDNEALLVIAKQLIL